MNPIISAKDVTFAYPAYEGEASQTVLDDISIDIRPGEFVAVLGHNGSGKSTLAKHFNAILLPSGGTVWVAGIDTRIEDKIYDIRQTVGMVFQNPDNQLVATIVEEDVAFALENLGVPPAEIRARVDDALKSVGMYEYREHAPHQLSGGQKQRIAIAGVIAMRPRCIVLDEPTAMLDPRGREEVLATIRGLNREHGITVVLITHYMDEAALCDRVVVVDNGRMLLDGVPKEVFSHVTILKEVGLDVPQVTELAYGLRCAGYPVPEDIIFEEECVDAIAALLEGRHVDHKN
ncbi:MAG: energy-coupling factor transporter ATPase [Oscillospiraceae bacterium]|nr:energy-coupling factor transporter ATPase [Oscillospiraceae bacterium]